MNAMKPGVYKKTTKICMSNSKQWFSLKWITLMFLYCITSSWDTWGINKRPYEPSGGLIWKNCCRRHRDEENIPSRNIGHFTTNWCLLQDHQWRSTMIQRGKHSVHDGKSPTNGLSRFKLFWNLHICLQILVWEAKRRKYTGNFITFCPLEYN